MKGAQDNANVINFKVVHHCDHTLFDIKNLTPAIVHDKEVIDNRVWDSSRLYVHVLVLLVQLWNKNILNTHVLQLIFVATSVL